MSFARKTSTRTKVYCYCKKCMGALVDPRTRNRHMAKKDTPHDYQEAGPSIDPERDNEMDDRDDNEMACDPLPEITDLLPEVINEPQRNYSFLTKKLPMHESESFQTIKKRKISDRVLKNLISDDDSDDQNRESEDSEDDVDFDDSEDEEDEDDDYEDVNFASPDFDNNEPELPNINTDAYTWIILWILQYQKRYKLSNVAIDSLFKFLSLFF